MKKIAKLSLVAAMVVTGLTAADLETSGNIYYEKVGNSDAANITDLNYDATFVSKASDNITGTFTFQGDTNNADQATRASEAVTLDKAFVTYKKGSATAMFGRQGISTPGTSDRGEGVLATYGITDTVTVVGGYFGNSTISATDDVAAAALLANLGVVNVQLWSVQLPSTLTNNTVAVGGNFGGVNVEARVATTSYEAAGTDDGSTTKISASGKAGAVSYSVAYIMHGEDGAAYSSDTDTKNTLEYKQLSMGTKGGNADATAFKVVLGFPVGQFMGELGHMSADFDGTKAAETAVALSYPLAKSVSTKVTYSTLSHDVATSENDSTRFEISYKF